ncbi:nucleotidyl transferase AbiEii/AbiGii toxin family protein [Flavobacterium sp. CS20]|uniref:nucleotidyl transferase AbiEii/AbiGii toxin family protein n=1 Tax=Flavobacterium sp. CS20 TaxID=2775246 RepID=UPI001FFCD0D8|nr:nucleotidyl transferase AbiEii/AbiGii toxin family protein [Flavobacterium sp. CS20]
MKWGENIEKFIKLANKHRVKMIMIGGGAVNFHGYQRHSADVDFWIDVTQANMDNLKDVFNEMGYKIEQFPEEVIAKMQNISIKFSPYDLDLELITKFSINKTFDEAYLESEEENIKGEELLRWKVLSFEDLITSKIKSSRPKDLLDIQQLKLKNNNNKK